jgi:tRNA U34 5-carboxymethylaminomethyl modifying GTPase MnmE/TrmE
MEMNIASAQEAIRRLESSEAGGANGLSPQAAAALAETKANIERGVASLASTSHPTTNTNGTLSDQNGLSGAQAERLQLIDEDQKFNPEITSYLKKWALEKAGFNYNLCAVVGSQSTGKSTLLNKLFGTSFDVMKENERRQTTKGE